MKIGATVLPIVAIVALCDNLSKWYNKRRNEQQEQIRRVQEAQERSRNEALKNAFKKEVLEVSSDHIDPENNGKPVFIKGKLIVDGPPSDPYFQVPTEEEILLSRKVEVYCWDEQV